MKKSFWIRLGCWLIGYNYFLIKNCSEAAAKTVKKYLSALLVISTLWAFIGYTFAQRYLKTNEITSAVVSALMVFIVIQIERQIILSAKNKLASISRFFLGLVMATIGAIITDQILFKDDIEKYKIEDIQRKVNEILPVKTQELKQQIQVIDKNIEEKEKERAQIIEEITKSPTISIISTSTKREKNEETGEIEITGNQVNTQQIPNPKIEFVRKIDEQIKILREEKSKKENEVINSRESIEKELSSKIGLLDELKVLLNIILESKISGMVWGLFFCFFLFIELLVLLVKWTENYNDYDRLVIYQKEVSIKQIDELASKYVKSESRL
ncbi:DUF4407 domain-containing protein [Raineya orbicola]|uniref:DUF4407 domain-containing protein n=1 Tax=Raineya orbicola TaxID=2016530 RepID=A0A2N3I338_9BACT|nr:DUF4407 domain-containing protein [Raineya orbicola]PKQ64706.1 hypothetical protein Rain11_2593 [Raineya orbicola]